MNQSLLLSEIYEQPAVIRRLVELEAGRVAGLGQALARQGIRYVVIAARGSSDNAGRYAQYVFGALNGLTVALATPSLYSVYGQGPRLDGALVLGISQSGQSPDIVRVLEEGRRQGAPTVAITNDPDSPLAAAAEHVIALHAGEERSVAATKTYSAELAALALLSAGLAEKPLQPGPLDAVPAAMEAALAADAPARAAAERMAASDRCVVLARGFNYATCFETALKMKELAYVVAEPYSSADFQHGPIAMVETGFAVVLVAVGDAVRAELAELRATLRRQGASLVVLGDTPALRDPADAWVPVPGGLPEWLSPLVACIPGQLLAYHLAAVRGHDPDRPRTIHKVTRTR